jgi:hypothetical protein
MAQTLPLGLRPSVKVDSLALYRVAALAFPAVDKQIPRVIIGNKKPVSLLNVEPLHGGHSY